MNGEAISRLLILIGVVWVIGVALVLLFFAGIARLNERSERMTAEWLRRERLRRLRERRHERPDA
jgi:hypothetical protein